MGTYAEACSTGGGVQGLVGQQEEGRALLLLHPAVSALAHPVGV